MSQTPSEALREMGAEFHHAAGKCKEALRAMESARLDRLAFLRHRLAFLRQCSKDSTARLATLKEELRTLPEQIAKWDAEAARLESQTAEDLDLTKLPPGTVCEATGQIARGSHVILPGERFAFAGSSTEFLARVRVIERDESFDVPTVVYARVVEVPR